MSEHVHEWKPKTAGDNWGCTDEDGIRRLCYDRATVGCYCYVGKCAAHAPTPIEREPDAWAAGQVRSGDILDLNITVTYKVIEKWAGPKSCKYDWSVEILDKGRRRG